MASSGEDGVIMTVKWLIRWGAEICFFDKTGRLFRKCFEKGGLNHHFTSQLNDGTWINISMVTREDSVLELNSSVKMHMSNGSRVEQYNCTEVQLNHATAGELITSTKLQLKSGSVLELNNNTVVNLNDGKSIGQNNLTTGQLNNGVPVQWYNGIEHWINHAAVHSWKNNKTEELVNGATLLWYIYSPLVRGQNVTMMHW